MYDRDSFPRDKARSDQWYEDRRGGIGGSDAAVVLGISPWKTPLKLYLEKRQEIPEEDIGAKEFVYWGTVLEHVIAREYARQTGFRIRRAARTARSKLYPHMICNVDREVIGGSHVKLIVEIKNVGMWSFMGADWGPNGSNLVPPYYYAQAQHNMIVTDAAQCDMPILIGGNELRIYNVPRDEAWCAKAIEVERAFWIGVQTGVKPAPVTLDDLLLLWPEYVPEKTIECDDDDVLNAYRSLLIAKDRLATLEADAETLEFIIKGFIRDADMLTHNGEPIATWRNNKKKADGSTGNRVFRVLKPKVPIVKATAAPTLEIAK